MFMDHSNMQNILSARVDGRTRNKIKICLLRVLVMPDKLIVSFISSRKICKCILKKKRKRKVENSSFVP